ncbi:MAG: SpoIIE family protein phosphatase [Pseudonocardia sp.]|nr:SpoIIE family protein phosphatase [Pseudonocardia sp.]
MSGTGGGAGAPADVRTLLEVTDWASSAVGPRESWPRELEDTVRFMLESRHPMAVWWGERHTLFYNDAFAPLAGLRHPEGFGTPLDRSWPEVAEHLAAELTGMSTGAVSGIFREDDRIVLHRHGVAEETYWQYSSTPVRGASGDVLGLITMITETTGKVIGARRLQLLAALGEIARDAPSEDVVAQRLVAVLEPAVADIGCAVFYDDCGEQPAVRATVGIAEPAADWVPSELPFGTDPVEFTTVAPVAVDGIGPPVRDLARAALRAPDGEAAGGVTLAASPLIPMDDDYRLFLRLVIGHVGTAVTAARVQEAERARRDGLVCTEQIRSDHYAGLGDEFRGPLTLVLGPLDRLREHDDPAVRTDVELAQRSAQRILKLVNGLLDVSTLQSGRVEGMYAPTELGTLTAELVAAFGPVTERAGLSLDVDCPPTDRPVWVDRDMWEKIVLNLLSNAVKFTHHGGVSVGLELSGEQAVLRVADTGAGIPAEEVDLIFDRFHRVRDSRGRTQEGSGLGLSLVQQLVRLHGGTVEVRSTPGVGSTFTVWLPLGFGHLSTERLVRSGVGTRSTPTLAAPYVAEAMRWMPPGPGAGTDRSAAGPGVEGLLLEHRDRVLVVDDDADMRGYLRDLLSERWSVQVETNGAEALDAARTAPPDLVVADVALPGIDGIELLRALRTDTRTAGVPVVLLSSRAGEEAAVEGFAAGADDYLVKPFSSRELLARVANHLQLGRVRRAAELQFRAMADSTPALIWVDDPGGHRVFVNRGWLDFTGATDPAGELGLDWRRRIHPDDRERYRSVTSAAARSSAPFEVEYRLRNGQGRFAWVLDRGAPVDNSERSGGYVGGCLDIDAQHREQRRHRIYSDVGESLEREITRTGRTDQLARAVVDEGLADVALVHEAAPDEPMGTLAVAAARPALEPSLWRLGPLTPVDGPVEHQPIGPDRLTAVLADLPADQRGVWGRMRVRSALVVPLPARGRTSARLTVVRCDPGEDYTADDLDLVSEIGRRAGLAVDNARLLEQERASAQRLGLMHRATAQMSAAATPGDVAAIAANHIVELLDADYAGVWQLRGDRLRALTGHGWDEALWRRAGRLPTDSSTAFGDVLRDRRSMWMATESEWTSRYPAQVGLVPDQSQTLGYMPLVAGGRSLGVLAVGFVRPRRLSDAEREAAVAVAELAAQALDRASMLEVETEARRLAERLGAIAAALSRATDLESVAEVIVEHCRSSVQAKAVVLLAVDDAGVLVPLASDGWPEEPARPDTTAPGRGHPLSRAVATGEPLWNAEAPQGQAYPVQTAVPLMVAARPIGVLGFRFGVEPTYTTEQRSFVQTLTNQCAQAIVRAQLHQAEHEVAVTLQRSLLPQSLPELDRMSLATRYRPGTQGTEAGGDWFDVLALDDGRVALVVGDVVGRGPSAAAVMGQLRSAVAANLVNGQSPAGALEQLDHFALRVSGAMASTVACAVIDCDAGELCYASAGHPPALLAGPDGVRTLDQGRGVPLGISGRPPFQEASDRIEPGETILLCSDGLFERRDEVIDDGLARLAAAFGDLSGSQPRDMADALLTRMSEGADTIPDDTVVLVARMMPAPLTLELDADPTRLSPLRRTIGAWCETCGMGQDARSDLQLTVGEAVTNAIEHAYLGGPGPDGTPGVALRLALSADGSVEVCVADRGRWRQPPADPGYRGRGIALIRELAEQLVVEPSEEGTEVRFRLPSIPVEVGTPGGGPPVEFVAGEPEPERTEPDEDAAARIDQTRLRAAPDLHGVRITVVGDLDLPGVAAIRAPLIAHLGGGLPVTLNLSRDAFVSSAGIALLSEVARRVRDEGTTLSLVAPAGSQARRALVLSGLDSVIGLSDDA